MAGNIENISKLNVEKLESAFQKAKAAGYNPIYRICDGVKLYKITVEDEGIGGSDALYMQSTADWEELVDFCSGHCNPGYDLLAGLGCTNDELADATIGYIHSLGKKYRYE